MTAVPSKVTVIITTYNHERFIQQAIDGVLMQETDFPFEVVVIDDCSTDRTRDIVIACQRAAPDRIRLVLPETNQGDNLAFMQAIQASESPFVALLDGDDYWTSKVKLQQQVQYLERHPECALCYHNVLVVYDDGAQEPEPALSSGQKEVSTLEDLLERCYVMTCSSMLRRRWLAELPASYVDDLCADWSLFAHAAQHGNIGYLNDVMGVYRQHAGGFWTGRGRIAQLEGHLQFYERLADRLPGRYADRIRTLRASRCHELAREHQRAGHHEAAVLRIRECLAADPDMRRILWTLRVAGGGRAELEFPSGHPDVVRVAIGMAAAATFDIQLNQGYLAVRANHPYRIEFRARADRPRSLYVGFSQAHDPWNGLGLHQSIALSPDWQAFAEPFVAGADDDNGRIHFDAGETPVSFEVASVTLRSLTDGRTIEPSLLSLRAS